MWTSEVRVMSLSTGALLYQHQYPSGQVASSVVASHDGRYLAEQTMSTDAQGHQINGDTLIRRTSDGNIVARLSGQAVRAFSWDGSRVITMPGLGAPVRFSGDRPSLLASRQATPTCTRSPSPAERT
jgi:hypothetical protein